MRYIIIFLLLLVTNFLFAQTVRVGHNSKLLNQISKNQIVRITSDKQMQENFKKQNEAYNKIKNKATQIMVIHEEIHSHLTNLSSAIKDAKKLTYTYSVLAEIPSKINDFKKAAVEHPEVAPFIRNYYSNLLESSTNLYNLIEQALHEDPKYLLDQYDRKKIINKVYREVRNIRSSISYIETLIYTYAKRNYLETIPLIGDYIKRDRRLVENTFNKIKGL